ncbi:MAG TPA: hypothetical protein VK646_13435 [Actinomycetota bacterium]|nr:hypothetical protein [Actinomycetota bacterium]
MPIKLVTTDKAAAFIAERGGEAWVWLDPRRGLVGSFVWLEAHTESPRSSRRSSFTRSSRRPHRFDTIEGDGVTVHFDHGRLDPPEELHLDVKGWRKGTRRLEAYWNGCVFAGPDVPVPERR